MSLQGQQARGGAVVVVVLKPWGWSYQETACVANAPPQVTPEMVRQQVVRMVPSAAIGLAPKQATLVNIQTIMWVDAPASQQLAPITLLGQQVDVTLALDHVVWSFGDGSSDVSDGPGKAYEEANDPCRSVSCPDYFGHVYRDTGTDTVRATAYWHASFTVDGGDAVDIPGTVAGPTGQAALTVKQARAVLVPNP